ncbi:hypothetical protein TRFO_15170 [Tritrichomonas foetus]|uniref:PPM-type phosphatase domain-containing protein n=1 Tax=Tritrichomonas foetus TaxID=1144522 RepID=A0A1J4KTC8_9EUKA|nr:hypothetical protein TRFO_15170 [Tritrichomonas foetus]|eukprot:OHT14499.1 hypothetical protein TRFO_15170 [Tritrichomonas foetus]
MDFFNNPQLTSIDIHAKNVSTIPITNSDLVNRITKVRMVNCQLYQLPIGFNGLVNLTHIELLENNFTSFDRNTFISFQKLTTLDLTANKLVNLNCDLPETLMTLDVSYNYNFNIRSVWLNKLPYLKVLKMTHCNISEVPKEKPSFLMSLRSLFLDGNSLTEFPVLIPEFPILEEISLFGNKIEKMLDVDFPQNFKTVNLYYNNFQTFEFTHTLKAQSFNMNANPMTDFPLYVLQIEGLKALYLAKCEISGKLDFSVPPTVGFLDLSNNQIQRLSERFVYSLINVSLLNLSNNLLENIPDCINTNCYLNRLFIDSNKLVEFPQSFYDNCTGLEHLSASFNKLRELKPFNFPRLHFIDLSFNDLTEIPDSFMKCSILSEINLSFNKLTDLPKSLAACRKMMFVTLNGNEFITLPRCILGFSQIKTLCLAKNKLTALPGSLGAFYFLKTLDLSCNHFQIFPELIGNLRGLRFLSLSHNAISEIPENFRFPENLINLDFSFNLLTKFDFELPSATSINLDYNLLTTFDFNLAKKAHFLSLNNNQINFNFIQTLETICSMPDLQCFEFYNNLTEINEIPPTKVHILSDYNCRMPIRFGVGYSATMGERPTMEDSITITSFDDKHCMFGVFDGHTGNVSSSSSASCIVNEIKSIIELEDSLLPNGFAECFTRVNQKLKSINVTDGSTAAVAFFRENKCYISGVGDSRIVRVKKEGCQRMTTDYKPLNRPEFERLRECGLGVNTEGRINRKLAVARALGDFWIGDGIFVCPEVSQFEIDNEDLALIIACDGLWDVFTDEEASSIVRKSQNAADAATALKSIAFALGSKDNISVIIVDLNPEPGNEGYPTKNTVELIETVHEEHEQAIIIDLPTPRRRRT